MAEPISLRCPDCGAKVSASDLTCPDCGKAVSQAHVETLEMKPSGPVLTPPAIGVTAGGAASAAAGEAPRKHISSADLGAVRTIGPYELLEEVARGGMGIIYRARQSKLNRIVALKVMIAGEHASEHLLRRFLTEARAAARLNHPNIVPIYDVGEESGLHYFTMEFVTGRPLSALIAECGGAGVPARTSSDAIDAGKDASTTTGRDARATMNAAQAVAIMEPVAEAVHYAHTQGIIHRDLKPDNIMIDERGQPRVADFGLARDVSADSSLTGTGNILGTPAYMSPEQAQGAALDPRSDVYALGVILYEMLSGKPPFHGGKIGQLLVRIAAEDPIPLLFHVPALDPDLETIVMTCLEKDPQRRYRTAELLAADLRRYRQGEPIAARPASLGYRLKKKLAKNKGLVGGAALAVLALAATSRRSWPRSSTASSPTATAASAWSCWTSIISRTSTTPTATRAATACCRNSRGCW